MTIKTMTEPTPVAAFIRVVGATVIALGLLLGVREPAAAQQTSLTRAEVVQQLDGRYSEKPVALGLASNGGIIEVFTTRDGSTWTIVLTMPNGMSAVVAVGESWTALERLRGRLS